jgi:AcrR family transcriptional regulator
MSNFYSTDPRAIRSRTAFQQAFKELLQVKPYQKITVTDITQKAGFARHTFYNHYDTKEDILNELVDSVLDDFFSNLDRWDIFLADPEKERKMITAFFQVWKENTEIVEILNRVDMEAILLERLKTYFVKFYYERVTKEIPKAEIELAKYMVSFLSYSLISLLKPWLQDEMKHPPEVMAEFLIQLSGAAQKRRAVERFKTIIR